MLGPVNCTGHENCSSFVPDEKIDFTDENRFKHFCRGMFGLANKSICHMYYKDASNTIHFCNSSAEVKTVSTSSTLYQPGNGNETSILIFCYNEIYISS